MDFAPSMKTTRTILITLIVVVASFVLASLLPAPPARLPKEAVRAAIRGGDLRNEASQHEAFTPDRAEKRPAIPAATVSTNPYRRSALHEQFLAARDFHQLYESLKHRNEPEALFLRASVLDLCQGWTAGDARPSLDERRERFMRQLSGAFRDLRKDLYLARLKHSPQVLCAGFKSRIGEADVEVAFDHAADAGDARAQLTRLHRMLIDGAATRSLQVSNPPPMSDGSMNQIIPRGPTAGEVDLLKAALASRDPAQILYAGPLLTAAYTDFEVRLLDGKGIVGVPDIFVWDSVACHFAGGCDQQSTLFQRDCIMHARCDAASYDELLQKHVLSADAYSRLVEYRNVFIQAIESGNWALLGEARGSPTNFQRHQILPRPRSPRFELRF